MKANIPICNSCGKQFRIGNLDSYQDLHPHAKRRGWEVTDTNTLCTKCRETKGEQQ